MVWLAGLVPGARSEPVLPNTKYMDFELSADDELGAGAWRDDDAAAAGVTVRDGVGVLSGWRPDWKNAE